MSKERSRHKEQTEGKSKSRTIDQGWKGWEITKPHLAVESPQSNQKSLEKMVRYFPWREAKLGGKVATDGTEEDQSVLTPASEGLHCKS